MFRWQRLVVDELHELVRAVQAVASADPGKATKESRCIFYSLGALEADARWGLTATPDLADAQQVSLLGWFHRVFVPSDSDPEAQHYLDEYARSNSWDDSAIPLESHLVPVRHTTRERAIYLNYAADDMQDPMRLLQLCSFFSPDDVHADADSAVVTTRRENEAALQRHRQGMQKAAQEQEKLQREADQGFPAAMDEFDRRRRRDKLKRMVDSRQQAEEKERKLESRARYFEQMLSELQKLDNEEVECTVCREKLEPIGCMVTSCGHFFCHDCIGPWVQEKGKCPTCTGKLQVENLQWATDVLSCEQESANLGRIAIYGTKVHAVCMQLESIWQGEPGAK